MNLIDAAKRLTSTFSQPNREAMLQNIQKGFEEFVKRDLNARAPGVQSLRGLTQLPVTQWSPFTAPKLPTTQGFQPIPRFLNQFRGNAMQALTFGAMKNQLPAPQTPAQWGGAITGGIVGSLPAFSGVNQLVSGGVANFNRLPTLARVGIGLGEGAIGLGLTSPGNLKQRAQTAYDYTFKPTPTNALIAGMPLLAPALSQAKRGKIADLVDQAILKSETQEAAASKINYITDQLISKGSTVPEYTQKLKALRAALNNKMMDLTGAKGNNNYKLDFKIFQTARRDPEISTLIDTMEKQIANIDDALKPVSKNYFHASPVEGIRNLRASKEGTYGPGVYLSNNKGMAREYAAMQGDGNIADIGSYNVKVLANKIYKHNFTTLSDEMIAKIRKQGYEGIESPYETVIFDPKKVKVIGYEAAPEAMVSNLKKQIERVDEAILNAPTQDLRIDRTKLPQNWLNQTNEEIVNKLGGTIRKQIAKPQPSKYSTLQPSEYLVKAADNKKVNLLDYLRTPDRVLQKIGLGKEAKELRQGWTNYELKLPKELNKVTDWWERVGRSENSSKNIFLWLDGDKKVMLNKEEQAVANEIKDYYKQWAKRLNLPEDKQISAYVTHIFAKDILEKDFDENLAKIIDTKVAKSVYDPFLQARLGIPGYKADVFAALDAYVKRATRKENMDPILDTIGKKAESLDLSSWKYVKSFVDRVNLRPTEIDNLLDNFIKQSPVGYKYGSRPTTAISRNIRQWIYRGTLGLNFKSAVKNLMQGTNTYAELGEKYTAIGYMKTLRRLVGGDDELQKVGVLSDALIQDRQLSAKKKALETLDKGLFYFFDKAEKINRGAAYYGAKQRALDAGKSMDEAIDAGIEMARKTQFTFGNVDTPPVLASDLGKLFLQFQSYSLKQGEYLVEMAKSKEYPKIARWLGANALILAGVGDLMGMDWKDLIPTLRIGGSPAFNLAGDIGKAALNSPDQYGQQPTPIDRLSTLGNDLVPFIPGGVAGKRAIQGLQSYNQGYSTNRSGNVQYPIEQTPQNLLKSVLFGKNSTPEGIEYYQSGTKPLSEKQSELFRQAMDRNFQYQQFQQARQNDRLEKQARTLVEETGQNIDLPDRTLYWDNESGTVKSVLLNRDVSQPKLTGIEVIDEKLMSQFKADITKATNDTIQLFQLGKITQDEAKTRLEALADLKDSVSKKRAGKKTTLKLAKSPTIKFKAPKAITVSNKLPNPPKLAKANKQKSLLTLATSLTSYKPIKPVIKLERSKSQNVSGIKV